MAPVLRGHVIADAACARVDMSWATQRSGDRTRSGAGRISGLLLLPERRRVAALTGELECRRWYGRREKKMVWVGLEARRLQLPRSHRCKPPSCHQTRKSPALVWRRRRRFAVFDLSGDLLLVAMNNRHLGQRPERVGFCDAAAVVVFFFGPERWEADWGIAGSNSSSSARARRR